MARSIHTTRRTLAELSKRKFATLDARAAALKKARAQLRRKRFLKETVKTARNQSAPPLEGTAIETIPVELLNESPSIHHALTLSDTRNLLARLPQGASEAITRIQFSLGKQYMEEAAIDGGYDPDPHTGRLGSEILPGIYSGPVLGTYHPQTGLVALYAFVYDPAAISCPRGVYETYLRIHAAKTLLHEIAHHHDHTQRVARGRWLADRTVNVEYYAEQMEHRWGSEIIVPFIEQNYSKQARELLDWVEYHGGVRLPLEFFTGDPRRTCRDGLERLLCCTTTAFESWVEDLPKHKTLFESRFAFAWELHYADQYMPCMQVLDGILMEFPESIPALACKADTLMHLKKYDEAVKIADWILDRDDSNRSAWEARLDTFEAREQWVEMLSACEHWEKIDSNLETLREILLFRAVAFCALDRKKEMDDALDAYMALRKSKDVQSAARHRGFRLRGTYRRAGKPLPDALLK